MSRNVFYLCGFHTSNNDIKHVFVHLAHWNAFKVLKNSLKQQINKNQLKNIQIVIQ